MVNFLSFDGFDVYQKPTQYCYKQDNLLIDNLINTTEFLVLKNGEIANGNC